MAISEFKNVKICGVKTVIPENYIDIDENLNHKNLLKD